jgi:solute carrier family 35 protein E3
MSAPLITHEKLSIDDSDMAEVSESNVGETIKLEHIVSTEAIEDSDDESRLEEDASPEVRPARALWAEKLITASWFFVNIPEQAVSPVLHLNLHRKRISAHLHRRVYLDAQLKDFQLATAVYHFSVTFLILFAASYGLPRSHRVFDPIYIPVTRMLSISAFFSAAVVLGNVRLAYCSIGFFQLSKILLTPATALLNYILFRKTTSRIRLVAIAVCCIGTAMTNTKEAVANPLATLIAFTSIIVAATYQIWISKRMGDLKVTAPQLLLNQAPLSVVILVCLMPFYSKRPVFSEIQTQSLLAFLASGIAAAGVNLSQFLIIGRTSPLTVSLVDGSCVAGRC